MSDTKIEYSVFSADTEHIPEIIKIENENYNYPWKYDNFKYEIESSQSLNLIIKINHFEIIGYIFSNIVLNEIFITNISIKKEYQNKKAGTFLLNEFLTIAKNKNVNHFFLDVKESNFQAINLYKKFDFKIDCCRKNFYSDGENALLMHLDIYF